MQISIKIIDNTLFLKICIIIYMFFEIFANPLASPLGT